MITGQPIKKPEAALKALVALIEELRARRQAQAAEQAGVSLKTFSQRELTDEACPSYKNYLLGRTNRLPERDMLLQIADYLECTPAETDDLLTCAGYLPESLILQEWEYQAAVKHANFVARLLPLPAAVIGRSAQTLYANAAVYGKSGVPAGAYDDPANHNVISWYFDPALAAHHSFAANSAAWAATARGAAELIYLTNSTRLRDPAFKRMLESKSHLPDFARLWQEVSANPPSIYASYGQALVLTPFFDQPIRETCWLMPITPNLEVTIVVGLPVDEAAQDAYTRLGCQLDAVQWQAMLTDYSAA